jgi:hypothetical protein
MDADRMVRGEHELRAEGTSPPAELLSLIPEAVDPAALHPVAVLSATRRVLTLGGSPSGERGDATVEVMDDTVEVRAPGGGPVVDRFRELEVEMQDGADDLADRVAARLREAGAGPPESTSKYRRALRALGHQV